MLDVLELEKKWSKYHSKKVLPLYITSFVLVILAGVSSYVYIMNPEVVSALINKEQIPEKVPTVVKVTKSVAPVQAAQPQKVYEQNVLVPSYDFIYNLEDQVINYKNAQILASVSTPKVTTKKKVVKPSKPKKPAAQPKKRKKPAAKPKKVASKTTKVPVLPQKRALKTKEKSTATKKSAQTIILGDKSNLIDEKAAEQAVVQVGHTTSKDELRSVIKRFNRTQKPALSLFISKKYYEQGDYKESYNYAKATYKLNPNIEDGVLLYSKSLVKLGHPDKAVSKLKPFIKKSGSIKAKILLNEIQKGNFQ